MQNNISVINFDGLHCSGKGTQIILLADQLKESGVSVLIRRGDGMRNGSGSEETDPVSVWWQENITRMREAGVEGPGSMTAATQASNRLNAEIYLAANYFLPHLMRSEGNTQGVLLLDRGLVSRLFVKRREDREADLESIRYFENRSGKHEIVFPNKIFLLHAPIEVLLDRNSGRFSPKSKFRESVLGKFYSDFELVMLNLPPELERITTVIDSTRTELDINREVRSEVSVLLGRPIREGNYSAYKERI